MKPGILKAAGTPREAMQRVAQGLLWEDAGYLAEKLDVSLEALADFAGVPRSTFFRRRGGRFPVAESEHIMRYARLWHLACTVFPTEEAARSWLGREQYGLDGAVPLEYARTELGARVVEDLLMRIHHGVLA